MKDDLESRLSLLQFRPLPPEWREQMLTRLENTTPQPRRAPPRWLAVGWGLAWAAVIVLHLCTPAEPQPERSFTALNADMLHQRTELMLTLLADSR